MAFEALRLRLRSVRLDWMLIASLALALPIICLTTLFSGRLPGTHDAQIHLYRVITAAVNLRAGIVWPRWGPELHFGFGYPIGDFYPPGWYVPAGALVAAGMPAVMALLLAQTAGILLYPVGGYLFGRLLGGRPGALLGAAIFLYMPFRFYELFDQGNLSQFIAMGLMAWVLWSLGRCALQPRPARVAAAGLLFGALMVMHHPTALVFAPFAGLYALLVIWFAPRDAGKSRRAQWIAVLGAYAIGVAIGMIYWLPAALESKYVNLAAATNVYQIQDYFVQPAELLGPNWSMDRLAFNPPRAYNAGQPQLILAGIGLLIALWPRSKLTGWQRCHVIYCTLAAALALYLVTERSLWLWQLISPMQLILYPWRLLGIVAIGLVPGAVIALDSLPKRWQPYTLAACLLIALLVSLPAMQPVYGSMPDLGPLTPGSAIRYEAVSGNLGMVSTGEYTPHWATKRPDFSPCASCYDNWDWRVFPNSGTLPKSVQVTTGGGAHPGGTTYQLQSPEAFRFELRQMYFPGWQITLDGQNTDIAITTPYGLMAVDVPAGTHTVEAWYAGTTIQHIGDGLALIGLILCAALFVWDARLRQALVPVQDTAENPRYGLIIAAAFTALALVIAPVAGWFRPSGAASQPVNASHPLNVAFSDAQGAPQVELIGYDVTPEGNLQPGDWLYVRLYWHALRKLSSNASLRTVVRLAEPGTLTDWARDDSGAPGGFNPGQWPLDRYVVDTHILRLSADTPAYVGNLLVSMYGKDGALLTSDKQALFALNNTRIVGGRCDTPPASAIPAAVNFGGVVALQSYTLDHTSGRAALDLYWTTLKAAPAETGDLSLFIHFMRSDQMLGNADQPPIAAYPSSNWQAGQCLHQRYDLDIPSGADRILVGFYGRADMARLPASADRGVQTEENGLVIRLNNAP